MVSNSVIELLCQKIQFIASSKKNCFIQLIRTTLNQVLFSLIILTIFAKSTWSDEKFSDESPSASPDVGFGFESLKSWYDCVPGIQGSIGGKFLIFYSIGSFATLYSFIFNFEWKSTTKNFYFQLVIFLDMTIKKYLPIIVFIDNWFAWSFLK